VARISGAIDSNGDPFRGINNTPSKMKEYPNSKYPGGPSRQECLLVYVTDLFDHLREIGIIVGGKLQVGPNGKEIVDQLKEMNFAPTQEEIHWAADQLMGDAAQP